MNITRELFMAKRKEEVLAGLYTREGLHEVNQSRMLLVVDF